MDLADPVDVMEGYASKVGGDLHGYKYGGSAQTFSSVTGVTTTPAPALPSALPSAPSYVMQETQPSTQVEGNKGAIGASGAGLQEDFGEGPSLAGGGGRKKKKKHKSGEEATAPPPAAGVAIKPSLLAEEELVDAAIPLLPENQDVEDLLFPSTLPPPGGTLVGGQYLLNNSLLDQILTEKKMQILQSPEVIEFLRKQLSKK